MKPLITLSLDEYNALKENSDRFLQYSKNNTTVITIRKRYGEDKIDIITTNEGFRKKINMLTNFYNSEILQFKKEQDGLLKENEELIFSREYYFRLHIETKEKLEQLNKLPEKIKKKYGICI